MIKMITRKKFLTFSLLSLSLSLFVLANSAQAITGREVMEQQEKIGDGFQDDSSKGKMILFDKKGGQTVREFNYKIKEEQGEEGGKAMIKIETPNELRGVGLLTHQNPGRSDDQWLYLPAMKKTKRIAGASKKGRFIGSDFNFDDLSSKDIDDYNYKLLREEALNGVETYVIEATPTAQADTIYKKLITWIRKDNYQPAQLHIFDEKGHAKTAVMDNYQQFNGYWRPLKVTMKDLRKETQTELHFSDIQIKTGLKLADFSKNALSR